ncbi:unnamed protein product [Cochlearia groenlandica]
MVKKASPCSAAAKATKNPIVMTKGSSSCVDTKRQKDLKPKTITKAIASKIPTTKKPVSLWWLQTISLPSKVLILLQERR